MKQEFIIKLQGKQYAKGRGRVLFMLFCFVVALIILMVYSSRYFIALLAPVFFLILRLKNLSAEKNLLVEAICTATVHDFGVMLSIQSTQPKLCGTHNILYSNTDNFLVSDRKVSIYYNDNSDSTLPRKTIEFYIMPQDVAFWMEQAGKFSK